jgi:hypothetical protein
MQIKTATGLRMVLLFFLVVAMSVQSQSLRAMGPQRPRPRRSPALVIEVYTLCKRGFSYTWSVYLYLYYMNLILDLLSTRRDDVSYMRVSHDIMTYSWIPKTSPPPITRIWNSRVLGVSIPI